MSFFDRLFGKGRYAAGARAAELRGDLARAAELFGEAGQPDEAARVMILRADAETDARARLQYLAQAAHLAGERSELGLKARLSRAELRLALAGDAVVSAVARHEVLEAARELEELGEPLKAADAYARAGDKEGEARALQAAGDVERLELLLAGEQHKDRESRARVSRAKDIDLMIACGKRREALAALDEMLEAEPEETSLRDRANALRSRRVTAPVVTFDAAGERWTFVLGPEVVVGRTDGTINVASNAVSRQHLRVAREDGEVVVRDLGSQNGTELRGVKLAGALPVHDALDLKLAGAVPLRVAKSARVEGAVEIEVAGTRYVACLGPARLPVPGLELAAGPDGWVELVVHGGHAYLDDVELSPRATLLAGDAVRTTRGADPALRLVS